MVEFNYEENFVPSRTTKDFWLFTRKAGQTISGVEIPGLFQIAGYPWQLIGFFAIILLESIATYWCLISGVAITAIIITIIVDFVLAFISHFWHKEICRLKNENVFTDGILNTANKRKIRKLKIFTSLFYFTILISAGVKCYWFYSVYQIPDSNALLVVTCYTLGAILHIACTGYALFTTIFILFFFRKEHSDYINSNGGTHFFVKEKPFESIINTSIELNEREVGRHKIIKKKDKYYFQTLGILTDKELREFIARQTSLEQKRIIAVEGVKHQYAIWQQ